MPRRTGFKEPHSSVASFEFEKHSKNSFGEFSFGYFPIKIRGFFGENFASVTGKEASYSRKWMADSCGLS